MRSDCKSELCPSFVRWISFVFLLVSVFKAAAAAARRYAIILSTQKENIVMTVPDNKGMMECFSTSQEA